MNTESLASINFDLVSKSFYFLQSQTANEDLLFEEPPFYKKEEGEIMSYLNPTAMVAWNILYSAFHLLAPDYIWEGGCDFGGTCCKMEKDAVPGRICCYSLKYKLGDDETTEKVIINDLKLFLDHVKTFVIEPLNLITSS